MHEAGIMREVLSVAESTAREAGCDSIAVIVLRVGAFSGVVPEALEFAFDALHVEYAMTTAARLEIRQVQGVAFCEGCQREFAVTDPVFECPSCGRFSGQLVRGRELELFSVMAAESDSPPATD